MKRRSGFTVSLIVSASIVATFVLIAEPAMAQEDLRSQVNIQVTGLIPKDSNATDSNGDPITSHSNNSAGFLAGYTFHLNRWVALEGDYGFNRNTTTYSGSFGTSGIEANVHQMTGAFLLSLPIKVPRMRPYALAGGGALRFDPTSNLDSTTLGALAQTKGAFLYGAGMNIDMTRHFGVRGEYRGMLVKVPDFAVATLAMGTTTHLAQPSGGIYFRF
jgi:outer membrane immunogenic protein